MAQLTTCEVKNFELPEPAQKLSLVNEMPGQIIYTAAIEGGTLIITVKDFLPLPGGGAQAKSPARTVLAE